MAIDTLAYTKALEAAGVERHVAEAHAEALIQALSAQVATKADLAALKYELSWRVFGVVGVVDAILFALLRGGSH